MSLWEYVDNIKLSLDNIVTFGKNLNYEKNIISIISIPKFYRN